MDSKRQNKISRLLQKELSGLFENEYRNAFGNLLITVTKTTITTDLAVAKFYLSFFPPEKMKDAMAKIEASNKEIRRHLGEKMKNQLRIIPEIRFYVDDSLDYIDNIEKLLK